MHPQNLNEIKLPYVIKDVKLFSPGNHNNLEYSKQAIAFAYKNTDWNERTKSLYLDHEDEYGVDPNTGEKTLVKGASVRNWAGEVDNIRFVNGDIRGDLNILDRDTAIKLAYGAHFGISPRGKASRVGNRTDEALVENFAIVINPAQKTAYIHNAEDNSLIPLDDNIVYYAMMEVVPLGTTLMGVVCKDEVFNLTTQKPTMEIEQLKEVLAEVMKTPVAELKDEVKKLSTEVEKMKCDKPKEEEELKAKAEADQLAAKKKEEEELAAKKEDEDEDKEDEELSELMSTMTAENLASWQELVKKYGLKGAVKHKAEMGKAEEKKEMSELKATVAQLSEKLNEAAPKKSAQVESKDKTAIENMSDRELDIRFFGMLQAMNSYEDCADLKLKEEGFI